MKRVILSDLVPGMVTAEDIFTYNNQLIIAKNTPLTDSIITRLEFYSVMSVRIDDTQPIHDTSATPPEEAQSHPTEQMSYSEQIQSSPQFKEFKEKAEITVDDLRNNINNIVEKGTAIDIDESLEKVAKVFESGNGNLGFFDMLHNMRQYDDLTYMHMMNVSLICRVLAKWLHFSDEDVELATLCGLFHDIGKLTIPDHIIKKPFKLTDEEYHIIQQHTRKGYDILMNQDIDEHVKLSALMHHERCDGSGYPLGLKGDKIDKFAKIVAIADVYDAMTAARVYRGPLCPFAVIEVFEKEGLQRYETEYILCFLENVVLSYMNNRVRLSDGREGEIVYINKNSLSKPLVKCDNDFVDLAKESNLSIIEII